MKTLYIECNMGAAGDMLMSALYELLEDKQGFLDTMNGLGLPGVRVQAAPAVTSGSEHSSHSRLRINRSARWSKICQNRFCGLKMPLDMKSGLLSGPRPAGRGVLCYHNTFGPCCHPGKGILQNL